MAGSCGRANRNFPLAHLHFLLAAASAWQWRPVTFQQLSMRSQWTRSSARRLRRDYL